MDSNRISRRPPSSQRDLKNVVIQLSISSLLTEEAEVAAEFFSKTVTIIDAPQGAIHKTFFCNSSQYCRARRCFATDERYILSCCYGRY
jgi:hypothetical protein